MRVKASVIFSVIFFYSIQGFADVVKLAADPWCPFSCDSKDQNKGLFVDLATELFQSSGHQVSYETLAWSRALIVTRSQQYHAVVGALKTDAPDFIYPTQSWADQKSCFFVKKGSAWKYKDISSLEQVSLGVVKDYTYGDPLDPYIAKHASDSKKIDFMSGTGTIVKLIKKLQAGRVGVIVDDESVVNYHLKTNAELASAEILNVGCLKAVPLYIAFGPNHPKAKDYARLLSEQFEKQKHSSKIKELYKRYGVVLR